MTHSSLTDKADLLARTTLFTGLERETLQNLARQAPFESFAAGDLIFRAGSLGEAMMVIASGTVRISALAPTARDVILTELGPGGVFGEIALLDGGERTADAHALTDCTALILERRAVFRVIRADPALALRLLELLCGRLRLADERMMDFAFRKLPPRLARMLLRISDGGATDAEPASRLALSQSELADMVGSSRENVNRCLGKWQEDGLIELSDGSILFTDREGLRRRAEAE